MTRIPFCVPLVLVLACNSPADVPIVRPVSPSWIVFGIVQDDAGRPLPGAIAEVVSDAFKGLSAISNDEGYFSFRDVSGWLIVRVWKDGYDHHRDWLTVRSDMQYEVRLSRVETDSIRPGTTIRSSTQPHAAPCDPDHWDARAPCRRLAFTPAVSGQLTVTVTWFGGSEIDANIVTSNGTYVAFSEPSDYEEVRAVAAVAAGERYEVWVSSYYDPQIFNLKSDLVPFTGRR